MSALANSRALVTGGLGLIGSAVVRQLVAAQCEVAVIDNLSPRGGSNVLNIADVGGGSIQMVSGDICERGLVDDLAAGRDFIFHCAAETSHVGSMEDPRLDLAVNVGGTLNLLEAARRTASPPQVIFASTRQVFGRPNFLPVNDTHRVVPPDVNAVNKVAAEQYLDLYNRVYGIRSTSLRLTNIYGPGMRIKDATQNFLGLWIKQVLTGEPIRIFGDGSQIRDFVFSEDCAELMLSVAHTRPEQTRAYVVGAGHSVHLTELAEMLIGLAGQGSIEFKPFPKERSAIDIGDFFGSYDGVRDAFGWSPRTSLKDGLAKTLEYFRWRQTDYL